MRVRPYVGITGFMDADEVRSVLGVLPYPSPRSLMVGVLASSKTAAGLPNKYPRRFPLVRDIASVFVRHPYALNLIHYSTDDRLSVRSQLCRLAEQGGPHLHGFQLNMPWPDVDEVATYRKHHAEHVLILQIGHQAQDQVEHAPEKLADRTHAYVGMINGILIDASGGKGKLLHPRKALAFLRAIRERDFDIGLGVAGGLCSATLNLVEPLLAEFSDLSIDAEGKLRTQKDDLDVTMATTYLSRALQMFSKRAEKT